MTVAYGIDQFIQPTGAMCVYFTASIIGKRKYLDNYQSIIRILASKHYTVISDHIIKTSESQIRLETIEQRLNFHKKLDQWLQNCDFVVAEVSFPSISVGYEISIAKQNRKPVLLLYNTDTPPSLFFRYTGENIICEKYTSGTLKEIIEEFISYAGGASDTRYAFFITSKIASYLEKVSKKQKIPKSVYLRHLIERHIREHPE
jgi:hypothetical protein